MAKKTTNVFSFRLRPDLVTRVKKHGFAGRHVIEDAFEKLCKQQDKLKDVSPEIYELSKKERLRSMR